MGYQVNKGRGDRPWKIKDTSTGKIVATSETKSKALKHIGHRVDAESRKKG